MSKACRGCQGRGRWQESILYKDKDGLVMEEYVWKECTDCGGTGISKDTQDGQDWDIGGDSYEDDE